jgi:hypothetical protein
VVWDDVAVGNPLFLAPSFGHDSRGRRMSVTDQNQKTTHRCRLPFKSPDKRNSGCSSCAGPEKNKLLNAFRKPLRSHTAPSSKVRTVATLSSSESLCEFQARVIACICLGILSCHFNARTYFFPALTFAHRARAAAAIRARPAAEICRLPDLIGTTFWPFTLAHRARCAAAILRRAVADIVRRPVALVGGAALEVRRLVLAPTPSSARIAASRRSRSDFRSRTICSRFAMRGIVARTSQEQSQLAMTTS